MKFNSTVNNLLLIADSIETCDNDIVRTVANEAADQITSLEQKLEVAEGKVESLSKILSGDITNQMKADCLGEFWFEEEVWSEEKEDYVLKKSTIDWVTCKDIYKAMLKSAQHNIEVSDEC